MGPNFTNKQWLTILVFAVADFCAACCVSLQSPFYPQGKNINSSTGAVEATENWVGKISSPKLCRLATLKLTSSHSQSLVKRFYPL